MATITDICALVGHAEWTDHGDDLEDTIASVAAVHYVPRDGLVDAAYLLVASGLTLEDTIALLPIVAQRADDWSLGTDVIAEAAADMTNAADLTVGGVASLFDAVDAIVRRHALTAPTVFDILERTAPLLASGERAAVFDGESDPDDQDQDDGDSHPTFGPDVWGDD